MLVVFGVAVACPVVVLSCVCGVCACVWDEALKAVGCELTVAEHARLTGWFRPAAAPLCVCACVCVCLSVCLSVVVVVVVVCPLLM